MGSKEDEAELIAEAQLVALKAGGEIVRRRKQRAAASGMGLQRYLIRPVLTGEQEVVLSALLRGEKQVEAAKSGKVAPETVSRWLHSDALFVAELERRRAELWDSIADRVRVGASKAVDCLSEIASDDGYHAVDRIRAAAALLKCLGERPAGKVAPEQVVRDWAVSRSLDDLALGLAGAVVVREEQEEG